MEDIQNTPNVITKELPAIKSVATDISQPEPNKLEIVNKEQENNNIYDLRHVIEVVTPDASESLVIETPKEKYFAELQRALVNISEEGLLNMLDSSVSNFDSFDPKASGFILPDKIDGINSIKLSFVSNVVAELWSRKMTSLLTLSKTSVYTQRDTEQTADFKTKFPKLQEMAGILFQDSQIQNELIQRYPDEYQKSSNSVYNEEGINNINVEKTKAFLTKFIAKPNDDLFINTLAQNDERTSKIIRGAIYGTINHPDIRSKISDSFNENIPAATDNLKKILQIAQSFSVPAQKAA